jgi:multicomponent Na+:H+ antiporter subunit D
MLTDGAMPPGVVMLAGAAGIAVLRGQARTVAILLVPLATLAVIWLLPAGAAATVRLGPYELVPVGADALARLFGTVFAFMAFVGGLFALRQTSRLEVPVAYAYAGCAIGVTFAGDLISVFIFWELMAVFSTVLIWSSREARSRSAGFRYLMVHLLGGTVLMCGIAGEVAVSGSVLFKSMTPDTWPRAMILAGFLINAAGPPLSAWLPDAYPEASFSGTVFLSAFTTKTAVLVLLRGFPGTELLIGVGLFMIFYGIIYAILENDMRRILAYSIVNQVGFMVAGVGIGTEMALNGAAAHAFAHIIYKALLLMSAGSVLYMVGKRKCTDLGGLYKTMPLTTLCGIVGALSISAFPLTSGFVSKSMISEAAAQQHWPVVWTLLTAASAGVFLHAGIKFPWFVFFQKDSGLRSQDPPASMRLAMIACAIVCIGLGVYPAPLYALLPYPVAYQAYVAPHVIEQLQLLLFSGLAFFLMLPALKRTLTITLDTDWLYRGLGVVLGRAVQGLSVRAVTRLAESGQASLARQAERLARMNGPSGLFARTWPTGSMVLWVAIMLLGYLLINFSRVI